MDKKGTREMNPNELDDAVNYLNYIKIALVENEKIVSRQETEIETLKEKVATLNWCVEQVQLQQAEIEALKAELKEEGALAQAWILYATKVQMLMPTMCEPNSAKELGWSTEYLKGYNDAVRNAKLATKKASEK